MKKFLMSMFLCLCLVVISTPAQAITLNFVDSGWYTHVGNHSSTNTNYIVGQLGSRNFRNWFVFDLSSVTDPITSAILRLNVETVTASATYSIWDVSTDITTLRAGGSGLVSIYNDLGTGTGYGSGGILTSESNTVKDFALNSDALNDLNGAGGLFALGGSYSTTGGYAMGFSGSRTRQLIIETGEVQQDPLPDPNQNNVIPEPATILLFGTGMAGAFIRKRR